jgi:hypothetical protein
MRASSLTRTLRSILATSLPEARRRRRDRAGDFDLTLADVGGDHDGSDGPTSTDGAYGSDVDGGDAAVNCATACGACLPCGCFPLDAAAIEAIDAGDGALLSPTQCATICPFPQALISCQPVRDAGAWFVRCCNGSGRRPPGLVDAPPACGTPLGAHFAEIAPARGRIG